MIISSIRQRLQRLALVHTSRAATHTPLPILRKRRVHVQRIYPAEMVWYDSENDVEVLDPPSFEVEPFYRVLLHYSQWTNKDQIARIVRFSVPIISMNECLHIVEMAESYETAIVVTVKKDDAELYMQRLLIAGLKSSIEVA